MRCADNENAVEVIVQMNRVTCRMRNCEELRMRDCVTVRVSVTVRMMRNTLFR
jgi:hypothetical protein